LFTSINQEAVPLRLNMMSAKVAFCVAGAVIVNMSPEAKVAWAETGVEKEPVNELTANVTVENVAAVVEAAGVLDIVNADEVLVPAVRHLAECPDPVSDSVNGLHATNLMMTSLASGLASTTADMSYTPGPVGPVAPFAPRGPSTP